MRSNPVIVYVDASIVSTMLLDLGRHLPECLITYGMGNQEDFQGANFTERKEFA